MLSLCIERGSVASMSTGGDESLEPICGVCLEPLSHPSNPFSGGPSKRWLPSLVTTVRTCAQPSLTTTCQHSFHKDCLSLLFLNGYHHCIFCYEPFHRSTPPLRFCDCDCSACRSQWPCDPSVTVYQVMIGCRVLSTVLFCFNFCFFISIVTLLNEASNVMMIFTTTFFINVLCMASSLILHCFLAGSLI